LILGSSWSSQERISIPDTEGVQLDDVRDRGRVPRCDSLCVRGEAKKAGEAMREELDCFDKEGGERFETLVENTD